MRADLYTAPFLFLLGAAFTYGGWTMDRLEIRQIHPASIPGLVPMLLGVALAIAAIVLFVQARNRQTAETAPEGTKDTTPGSLRDLAKAAALCCIYALGLVGNIPFGIATALFITCFVIAFEADPPKGRAHLIKVAVIAIALGILVAAAMSILFRYAFLVRLP
ncbi:tripartite tricarboxylate transporter TctB family protein [Labrenzia sp. OB1]|uniref:tripartite tricarboxylate transporter TctB family protein n=1 Tax=Labrenzia sp. OB1 TaxID=1561204 RepID=UPI00083997F1|nr:tripartite tricarboxylate transporter TctB family protein [Labrenzia sp. OB1]